MARVTSPVLRLAELVLQRGARGEGLQGQKEEMAAVFV